MTRPATVFAPAYAKINLTLAALGRRGMATTGSRR